MSAEDSWKLNMLRKMWSGEDHDPEKDKSSGKSLKKTSRGGEKPRPSVDLHRYKELSVQLSEAEKAIDRAITDGHSGIIIIHGKGEGILRSELIKELDRHQHVAEITSDTNAFGESGALKIKFK